MIKWIEKVAEVEGTFNEMEHHKIAAILDTKIGDTFDYSFGMVGNKLLYYTAIDKMDTVRGEIDDAIIKVIKWQ